MKIIKKTNELTVKSTEKTKLFMSLVFVLIGCFIVLNGFNFTDYKAENLWGFVFVLPALLLALDIHFTYAVLNKLGPSKIVYKTFRKQETIDFNISDVEAVRKKEYTGIGNGSHEPNDILQLRIKGHGLMDIAATRKSVLYAIIFRPYRRQGKIIAEFLGVPFEIKKINLLKEFIKDPHQDEPQ
jgi:hypothetical protein